MCYAEFMQKGFALPLVLIGILLASFVGAGGYYLYQTKTKDAQIITAPQPSPESQVKDETANWKTYINKKYKFTIKYPESWYVSEYMPGSPLILLFDRNPVPKDTILTHPWQEFTITVDNLYPSKIFTEIGTIKGEVVDKVEYGRTNITKTDFKGLSAIKSYLETPTFSGLEGSPSTSIYFNYSSNGWVIRYPNINYNGEHDSLYDQILSTFKFLDDETANWKSYKNEEFGFVIKYPNNYALAVNDPSGKKYPSFLDKRYLGLAAPGLYLDFEPMHELDLKHNFQQLNNFDVSNAVNGSSYLFLTDGVGKKLYANCTFYEYLDIVDYCNKILSTIDFYNK